MNAKCPCCGSVSQLGTRFGFKLGMVALPTLLGPRAFKSSPWGALALLAFAAFLGHQLDQSVLPNCPKCRVVLEKVV